jgi:hypothetical protein
MLAGLEAQLALVPVAYAIVSADRLELGTAARTLADAGTIALPAHGAPLADLKRGRGGGAIGTREPRLGEREGSTRLRELSDLLGLSIGLTEPYVSPYLPV